MFHNLFYQIDTGLEAGLLYKGEASILLQKLQNTNVTHKEQMDQYHTRRYGSDGRNSGAEQRWDG